MKAHDASIRETVIQTIREYRRSLKRLMRVQHRALKPLSRSKRDCTTTGEKS